MKLQPVLGPENTGIKVAPKMRLKTTTHTALIGTPSNYTHFDINAHTSSRKLTRFRCGRETGFHAVYAIESSITAVRTTPVIPNARTAFLEDRVRWVYSRLSRLTTYWKLLDM
jgi:hypothetical protein